MLIEKSKVRKLTENLPNTPGVYMFYSDQKSEIPIYIGKSINIKKRVLSHYYASKRIKKENKIMSQVSHIKYLKTAGELGALLKEATLIKELQPIYNKRLRKVRKLFIYNLEESDSLLVPTLNVYKPNNFEIHENSFGLYRSIKQSKNDLISIAKNNHLCLKKLNIENGNGPCFNYHLNRCKGICCDKESIEDHNFRLICAIKKIRNHIWPYNGPIFIEEGTENNIAFYAINNWCFLGEYKEIKKFYSSEKIFENTFFDIDHYKILVSYMLNNPDKIR